MIYDIENWLWMKTNTYLVIFRVYLSWSKMFQNTVFNLNTSLIISSFYQIPLTWWKNFQLNHWGLCKKLVQDQWLPFEGWKAEIGKNHQKPSKTVMDSMFSDLAVAFGMGSMPILNGENRKLQDQLVNRQIECERVKGKNQAKLYISSAVNIWRKTSHNSHVLGRLKIGCFLEGQLVHQENQIKEYTVCAPL